MKLMLTSFGIEQTLSSTSRGKSLFDRMPPVSFHSVNEAFMPDYELLILCDQVVMDATSFQQLISSPSRAYSGVADTFRALKTEGRVELVDFSLILRSNADLLDQMLDHDMRILDQWVAPLRESLTMWRHFAEISTQLWNDEIEQFRASDAKTPTPRGRHMQSVMMSQFHDAPVIHRAEGEASFLSDMVTLALDSSEKRKQKKYRGALREVLRAYLSYVNANLVLSTELEIGFHDWLDFTPFYSTKFLSVGKREDAAQEGRKQVERLFAVAFPDLAVRDTTALLKVLNDKRIHELRQLISDAVLGKCEFDEHFANSVLSEVLQTERKVTRFRNVLGYLTLPIGLMPWIGTPVQKLVEEAVARPMAKKMKQKHKWFYMLSEVADSRRRNRSVNH